MREIVLDDIYSADETGRFLLRRLLISAIFAGADELLLRHDAAANASPNRTIRPLPI
jgi:hypothetical protein